MSSRVLSTARKFKELKVIPAEKEIKTTKQIDTTIRTITAGELLPPDDLKDPTLGAVLKA